MNDLWLWAERLSWLVAIIGIPSLLIGFATMVRRPKLAVGFVPMRKVGIVRRVDRPTPSLKKKLGFTLDPNLSDAITLQFVIKNVGRGTARDLLVNFLFPAQMQLSHVSAADAPANTQFLVHPQKKRPLWTFNLSHIHPDDEAVDGIRGTDVPAIQHPCDQSELERSKLTLCPAHRSGGQWICAARTT